ncbi:CPBP family intramembrane glutamic endopeptidase [Marisediminicola sp. LYQ85]|uniref:CPBP family intramembrane glutamic endopeptidase n=1 Tax=Marisediminicola sp. LYQ85 TaxID=3391062 RepID=UPI003983550A
MQQCAREPRGRRALVAEILIVLALSFGASAIYAIIAIIDRSTRDEPISSQTARLNPVLNQRELFDLVYQVLGIAVDLVPVALVVYLLWSTARPHLGRLGIDFSRPGRDTASAVALVAIVGIPGLGVFFAGRALGLTVAIDPGGTYEYWWTVPVLILSAARAGITEEVIMVGYLFARLRDVGWGTWSIILSTAVLRGAYHLYQGVPGFVGNVAMGILFGWLYSKYGRVLPLVIAHTLIDVLVFVGYPWAFATFPALFAAG